MVEWIALAVGVLSVVGTYRASERKHKLERQELLLDAYAEFLASAGAYYLAHAALVEERADPSSADDLAAAVRDRTAAYVRLDAALQAVVLRERDHEELAEQARDFVRALVKGELDDERYDSRSTALSQSVRETHWSEHKMLGP